MNKLVNYVKDTKSEMKHVSWPSKKQTINFTVIVVGISVLVAILLGFFDFIFNYILRTFII